MHVGVGPILAAFIRFMSHLKIVYRANSARNESHDSVPLWMFGASATCFGRGIFVPIN